MRMRVELLQLFLKREEERMSFFGRSGGGGRNQRLPRPDRNLQEGVNRYHSTPSSSRAERLRTSQPLTYQPGMRLQDYSGFYSDSENGISDNEEQILDAARASTFPEAPLTSTPNDSVVYATPPSVSPSLRDITRVLQQQQGTLAQILKKEEELEKKYDTIQLKLSELEMKVESPSTNICVEAVGKRKRLVNRDLSHRVSILHDACEEKFNPEESRCSQHNKLVSDSIIEQIVSKPDNKYTKDVVKVSVKRCYENIRRNFLEMQQGKEDFVLEQSKRRKYRSRRQRKFDRRSTVVTATERSKYWEYLSHLYMTEESDDPEDCNTIIEHKLSWRSEKLDEYIAVLESRLGEKTQKECSGIVAKKVRSCGVPSSSRPPAGAPSWAVKKERDMSASAMEEITNH